MLLWATFDQNSVIVRVKILDSTVATGAGKTGLTSASAGLIIGTIADSEATTTAYTVTGSTIETITTLGTYAAPTATKCRFKEVDATNHPGIYELQFADARFSIAGAKSLLISISGATGAAQCDAVIPLPVMDLFAAQLPANVTQWLGTAAATPTVAGVPEVDLTHVAGATTNVAALATNVDAILVDTGTTLDARIPVALVNGRMDSSIGAVANGVIAAASFAANALDAVWSTAVRLLTAGTNIVLAKGTGITGLNDPTAAENADAVWDEALAGHLGVGSTGAALNAAGGAGDPWSTAIPGAYGAGTAGKILGDNINATISSRATQASVDIVDDFLDTEVPAILAAVDTEVGAIKAVTDLLPNAGALTALGNLDAAVSTRLATAGYTAPPTAIENADAALKRDWTLVVGEAARSTLNALRAVRNKVNRDVGTGVITVMKEDDATPAWTAASTTDAAAAPIITVDPT